MGAQTAKTERFETSDTRVGEDPNTTRTLDLGRLGVAAIVPAGSPRFAGGQRLTNARVRWRLNYLLMPPEVARDNSVSRETNVKLLHEGVVALP